MKIVFDFGELFLKIVVVYVHYLHFVLRLSESPERLEILISAFVLPLVPLSSLATWQNTRDRFLMAIGLLVLMRRIDGSLERFVWLSVLDCYL